MEQQQTMPLVLSDFIANASSSSTTLMQGKKTSSRGSQLIPSGIPHKGPGKTVLVENDFFKQYNLSFTAWRPEKAFSASLKL